MAKTDTVRLLIDTLMDNKCLKMWTIFQEESGSTLVKLRFVDSQNGVEQQDQVINTNDSNMCFKRKSDKQLKRDRARVQHHKEDTSRIKTRSMSKSAHTEEPNESIETARFDIVDGACAAESQQQFMDTSMVSLPDTSASDSSVLNDLEPALSSIDSTGIIDMKPDSPDDQMHLTELDVPPDNLDMVECYSGSSELSHITHVDNDGACFDSVNVPQTPDEPDASLKDILLVLRDWKHELESGPVK